MPVLELALSYYSQSTTMAIEEYSSEPQQSGNEWQNWELGCKYTADWWVEE